MGTVTCPVRHREANYRATSVMNRGDQREEIFLEGAQLDGCIKTKGMDQGMF